MARRSFPDPAYLLLGATVLAWAGAFSAIKRLTDDGIGAPDIAIGRYLVAAPGFAAALWWSGGLPGLTRRELGRLVAAGLFVVAGYHLALNRGEADTSAGASAVIVAVAPGLTMLLSVGVGLERFSRRRLAGLAAAFAGVLVGVLLGSGQSLGAASLGGPLLVVGAAATFAAYNVLAKPLVSRHSPIAVTAAASLIGTLALLPLSTRTTWSHATGMGLGPWLMVLYLGVVCTLAGYIAWTVALRRVDPSRAVSFIYGIPALAVAIGALTLGEPVTAWLAAGGLLIVGGVALAQ